MWGIRTCDSFEHILKKNASLNFEYIPDQKLKLIVVADVVGCEYGDRNDDCKTMKDNGSLDCYINKEVCCESCAE
jgi:hypothetical protein